MKHYNFVDTKRCIRILYTKTCDHVVKCVYKSERIWLLNFEVHAFNHQLPSIHIQNFDITSPNQQRTDKVVKSLSLLP